MSSTIYQAALNDEMARNGFYYSFNLQYTIHAFNFLKDTYKYYTDINIINTTNPTRVKNSQSQELNLSPQHF